MTAPAAPTEWATGWRIVLAGALANATGISLLFYTFNLFVLPMAADLHLSRAQGGQIQSAIIAAALGAPVIGWLCDRISFHRLFLTCTLIMVATELAMWSGASSFAEMFIGTAIIGFIGGGSSTVLITRPINAHFKRYRGLALGLVGIGISVSTIVASPLMERIIAVHGWRSGFLALAGISLVFGLPAAMFLMPRKASIRGGGVAAPPSSRDYLKTADFWMLVAANFCASMATASAIGQLSPMLQERGLTAAEAAWGISFFAAGQFVGKLGGGWLLDRFEPRLVAATLNALPTLGFALLLTQHSVFLPLMLAAGLIGLLQGADIGVFSYFVAHRFDVSRYGAIFGAMHGLGWVGNALALVGAAWSFDYFHGYWAAQLTAIGLLLLTSALISRVRLVRHDLASEAAPL